MAKLRIPYNFDHDTESPVQLSSAPPVAAQKEKEANAPATRGGSSAGPTIKHGVRKRLMVQLGLLARSKKASFEHRAREDKKKKEKKKKEEKKYKKRKKRKKKGNEVGGTSTEPPKKRTKTDENAQPSEPSAETAIFPSGEHAMVAVDVHDSSKAISERYDINFRFKGEGKHIAEVPSEC